jgi:cytochrome c
MVKKGVAYIKAHPHDQAFAAVSNPNGEFVDRDLYLVVYRIDGTNLAHGFNQKMIGKNLIDLRDGDGKEYWRERIELAKTKASFWQDLKFVDPLTRKMEPKSTYCERLEDMLVCGGVYKVGEH